MTISIRGIALGAAFLMVACDPAAEPGGGSVTGTPTGTPTGTVETIPLNFKVWNEPEACWDILELEVAAEYWQPWYDNGCSNVAGDPPYENFGTTDGQCIGIRGGFREGCEMADPWIVDCSEVTDCCDRENATSSCD